MITMKRFLPAGIRAFYELCHVCDSTVKHPDDQSIVEMRRVGDSRLFLGFCPRCRTEHRVYEFMTVFEEQQL